MEFTPNADALQIETFRILIMLVIFWSHNHRLLLGLVLLLRLVIREGYEVLCYPLCVLYRHIISHHSIIQYWISCFILLR